MFLSKTVDKKHDLRIFCRWSNLSRFTRFWGDQWDHKFAVGGPQLILRAGGSKAVWNFSKNSSVLVGPSFPKRYTFDGFWWVFLIRRVDMLTFDPNKTIRAQADTPGCRSAPPWCATPRTATSSPSSVSTMSSGSSSLWYSFLSLLDYPPHHHHYQQ